MKQGYDALRGGAGGCCRPRAWAVAPPAPNTPGPPFCGRHSRVPSGRPPGSGPRPPSLSSAAARTHLPDRAQGLRAQPRYGAEGRAGQCATGRRELHARTGQKRQARGLVCHSAVLRGRTDRCADQADRCGGRGAARDRGHRQDRQKTEEVALVLIPEHAKRTEHVPRDQEEKRKAIPAPR